MPAMTIEDYVETTTRRVVGFQQKLINFTAKVMNRVLKAVTPLTKFVAKVASSAKDLASKVGKAAINKLISLSAQLQSMALVLMAKGQAAFALTKKILVVLRKAMDPKRLIKTVKALMARFAKMFRDVANSVVKLVAILNPVEGVLAIIGTFAMVLRLMYSWITGVTGIHKAVRTALDLSKKAMKTLKKELGLLTKVVKDTNMLKPA